MKIVVIGDIHFGAGYSLGTLNPHRQLNTRLIDFSNTFDYVINYIKINNIKHLVICGDVFEHRRPSPSELSLFSEKLQRLTEFGVFIHIIIGNHDLISDQNVTTLDVLDKLKLEKIKIYTDITSIVCEDGGEFINLILFPYRTKSMLSCKTNELAISRLSDRLKYELRGISNGYKILIGHFIVTNTNLGNMLYEGLHNEIIIPIDLFKELDGVIMGHIHAHQILQKDPLIAYIGSMERIDFGESGQLKYFLSVDVGNDLIFQFEKLPVRPIYDLEIDQIDIKTGSEVLNNCINFLENFSQKHTMLDSIVRVNIIVNQNGILGFDETIIKNFLKKKLYVSNCIGIFVQVQSKRQLRKETISERNSPLESFTEYLTLVDDQEMKDLMFERGSQIIRRFSV